MRHRISAGWIFRGGQWVAPAMIVAAILLTACNYPLDDPGPPPRPTVIVITATGPYYEGFDDPESGWLLGDAPNSTGRIEDGMYYLAIKKASTLVWTNQQRVFGDGVYEVDATFVSGPESSAYGLLLLGTRNMASFVYVMITDDGRYDIGTCDQSCDKQESIIGDYTLAYAIRPGDEGNHLRVELAEGTLSLVINGAPVSTIQGFQQEPGLLGFIGESGQYGGFEAAFDNLQVVEEGYELPPPAPQEPGVPTPTIPALIEPSPIPQVTP